MVVAAVDEVGGGEVVLVPAVVGAAVVVVAGGGGLVAAGVVLAGADGCPTAEGCPDAVLCRFAPVRCGGAGFGFAADGFPGPAAALGGADDCDTENAGIAGPPADRPAVTALARR